MTNCFRQLRGDLFRLKERCYGSLPDIHRPSAIEAWLDEESSLFWNEDNLSNFRSPRQFLHSGTMNWPNRRLRYNKWHYIGGGLQLRSGMPLSRYVSTLLDYYDNIKGRLYLFRLDRQLRSHLSPSVHRMLSDISLGNPFIATTSSGRLLTEPVLRHGYYLGQLIRHLPEAFWSGSTILEIGGGYGSLARVLKVYAPTVSYFLVDLLERLTLQAYYLSHAFPGSTFRIFDHDEIQGDVPDFLLVPTWKINSLPENGIDLVINTHSLHEMTSRQIEYYVEAIHRLCRGYFYCVNRYEKRIGNETVTHPRDLLDNTWEVILEQPQPNYPHILEGLYRRRANDTR